FGIDTLHTNEHPRAAGADCLFDEPGDLVTLRIDLDQELEMNPAFLLAQGNQAVEDCFPILVSGQIIVGDEETHYAVGKMGAHKALYVVGVAESRLAPLDINDRAEAALERTAAAGVEGDG